MENGVSALVISSSSSSSKQSIDSDQSGASSSNNQQGSLNQGLTLWNQTRQQWVENKRTQTRSNTNAREPTISWNATYESLLGTSKPFHKPIPLFEMIDFLVDIWVDEGLYEC